jgi:hypothetical protein
MLRRTFSPAFFNQVANDPTVRPWLGGADGPVDLAPLIENPAHVALQGEHGGFLLVRQDSLGAIYELHTLFKKKGRGKPFFAEARDMFRFMFTRTDCLEIVTKCPDNNPGARMAAATVGFRERFRREAAYKGSEDAEPVGCSFRVFSVDDWFVRDGCALAAGRTFHEALETTKLAEALDGVMPIHPDDETHDRAVGAAVLMAWGGKTAKGVIFYNRWAQFAGYAPVTMIDDGLVDIQEAIVALQGGLVEVLHLRA